MNKNYKRDRYGRDAIWEAINDIKIEIEKLHGKIESVERIVRPNET